MAGEGPASGSGDWLPLALATWTDARRCSNDCPTLRAPRQRGRDPGRVPRVRHRAGAGAVPGAGGGDPRAAGRQPRDPRHADGVGQVAGRPRRPLRRPGPGAAHLLHRPDQGAGQREVLRPLRRARARTRWACSPATPRSTPTAPVICCTAEILANMALRDGAAAPVDVVIMDEFHYYADRDRGWAWQVPLLELTGAQFLLMSATLGPVRRFQDDLERRTGRPRHPGQAGRAAGPPRVRVPRDAAPRDARRAA